ncbi:MAG: DEAD/DEAH box helicase [Patescibacteria group bacterium]
MATATAKREIPAEVRAEVLERDENKCRECGSKQGLNLHHVLPEQFGGKETPDNLITVCKLHHKAKHVEFHMFYGDSRSVVAHMRRYADQVRQLSGNFFGLMGEVRLKPVLYLLTGQRTFRPSQEEVIRDVLAGRDVLFVTPTGSGKSLCFQLPGLLLDGQTMVISPLKSLMKDQVEGLLKRKVPATYINSDLGTHEKNQRIKFALEGLFRFLYVTPERFFQPRLNLKNRLIRKYKLLAVDEAHCIDLWGRNFRPSYAKLGELKKALGSPPTLALTATASKRVQKEILKSLDMPNAKRYVTGFHRPEIELYNLQIPVGFKDEKTGDLLRSEEKVDAAKADLIERILKAPKYYKPNPRRRWRMIKRDIAPKKFALVKDALSEHREQRVSFYQTFFRKYKGELRAAVKLIRDKKLKRGVSRLTKARQKVLWQTYQIVNDDKVLIFVPTVTKGKELRKELEKRGIAIDFYHGKLPVHEKTQVQNRYSGLFGKQSRALISTSAFGMGIDISNIRRVVHYSVTASLEDYYQQIGRAGRDRKRSKAFLLYAPGDEELIRFMNEVSKEDKEEPLTAQQRERLVQIEEKELSAMLDYLQAPHQWRHILDYFGETV